MTNVPSPSTTHSPPVFLSHSSTDTTLAQELCSLLEIKSVRCRIAPGSIAPGATYAEEIDREIESCSYFILLATSSSVTSSNVIHELGQAYKLHKRILTVVVGLPSISGQVDGYVSRLHWMTYKPATTELMASRLAEVMSGRLSWEAVSTPPSIKRRLLHAGPAFLGSLVASIVLLVVGAAVFWQHEMHRAVRLQRDYHSLGWVAFADVLSGAGADQPGTAQMQIFVGNKTARLSSRIKLLSMALDKDGSTVRKVLSQQLDGSDSGVAVLEIPVPPTTQHLTTCLTVPSEALHGTLTVLQNFGVSTTSAGVRISAMGKPRIVADDGASAPNGCT